jgi:hypothetical protein
MTGSSAGPRERRLWRKRHARFVVRDGTVAHSAHRTAPTLVGTGAKSLAERLLNEVEMPGSAVDSHHVTHVGPGATERRSGARVPLGMPVRLRTDGTSSGVLVAMRDVSAHGAWVELGAEADAMPSLGGRVALGFMLPDGGVGLARGRVVRVAAPGAGAGFGVLFDSMNEPFAALLDGVCAPPRAR